MASIITIVSRVWLQAVVVLLVFTILTWLFLLQRLDIVERGK
jgi:hypothetical protein